MNEPPKRSILVANAAMREAAGAKGSVGVIAPKPVSRLEQNTRVGHVFWCAFSPHNWPPEFDDRHLVVVIRGGARHEGAHLVVPLTSRRQTGQFGYRLAMNPNPRSANETWAACDHIYTVASSRLEQLRDDEGNYRRSAALAEADLIEIGRRVFASLNSLRRVVFGPAGTNTDSRERPKSARDIGQT